MSPRLAFALDAAHQAGRLTLGYFQTGTRVDFKADGSPVTEADKGAERLIRELIRKAYPGEAILGEEEGETTGTEGQREQGAEGSKEVPWWEKASQEETRNPASPLIPPHRPGDPSPSSPELTDFSPEGRGSVRWVIDPIDGTKSFVCGVPLFATLISLEEDGEPVLGVCRFPALDEVVYAEKGNGCFWNGNPCRVSAIDELGNAMISSGSQFSMGKAGRAAGFQKIVESARATRGWTDAYGHALVATGRIEAMVDPIVAPWDISAMRVIVREAGGRFTDFRAEDDPQTEAIASNGLLHDSILEVFRA